MSEVVADYRTFLDDTQRRRKRRRLDAGLSECPLPAPDVVKAAAPKSASDEARISALEGSKQRKAIAYGLYAYDSSLDSFRSDFSSEYVRSGRRSVNFAIGTALNQRFEEHPKLRRLIDLHAGLVEAHAHPPTHITADLRSFDLLSLLPVRYDSILIDPPLHGSDAWSWADLEALPVPQLAVHASFIWIWVGSGSEDGLEKGRALLARWGYRRCEDITWLKTNRNTRGFGYEPPAKTVFTNIKEHCLMGIRGTVRRSTDGDFVHCNVDTDVIFAEQDERDPSRKPDELFHIIENFCLGTRRLNLFAHPDFKRPGWLSINSHPAPSSGVYEYEKETYDAYFDNTPNSLVNVVPSPAEIEALRPRTPPGKGDTRLPTQPSRSHPTGQPMRASPHIAQPGRFGPPTGPAAGSGYPIGAPTGPSRGGPPAGPRQPYVNARPPPQQQAPLTQPQVPQGPIDLNALASSLGGWQELVSGIQRGKQR